ncbi:MAG: hypothetical protein KGJ62_04035 [Armatimonadetes bacterium]|nr:hypothetical protein [Armatimonadota bacterium]MDE2205652.1 hypothetical protein [Armatimonadota bacterium]
MTPLTAEQTDIELRLDRVGNRRTRVRVALRAAAAPLIPLRPAAESRERCRAAARRLMGQTAQQRELYRLEQLIGLLESRATTRRRMKSASGCRSRLSQLARLRAAHANYVLATHCSLRRVAQGAWLDEKYL